MERTSDSSTTDSTDSPAPETTPTAPSDRHDEGVIDHLYDASAAPADQRQALVGGDVPVAVYGLGKMGLPVASVLASVTGNVVGADVDPDVVESVNAGESHVRGEPGLDELVAEHVADGSLRAVVDPQIAADEASIHVVIVPTLLTEENDADLSIVDAVVDAIAAGIEPGDAVFVESTVPPGTCADRIAPRIAERSGLDRSAFGVAFCPERTASGRALRDITESYPKVVGGGDAESTRVAALVYDEVTDNDVVPVRDATTAEATKVFGGVYRDVNIALANEFARYADAMGIDVREAIAASNTQPHSHILSPGPGVGGHCIPVYPYFLLSEFAAESPLVRIARLVNDGMPTHVVDRLRTILQAEADDSVADGSAAGDSATNGSTVTELDGARVLVLGVTYRPGVNELRNSPSYELIEELSRNGATVDACDPLVDDMTGFAATPVSMADAAAATYDAVVMVTPHEEFSAFDWDALEPTVVLDCHDAVDLDGIDHHEYTLGRASALDGVGAPAGLPDTDR